MSGSSDDVFERYASVDDEFFEALLLGRAAEGRESAALHAFVSDVRTAATGPAPAPSPQLAQLFAAGFSSDNTNALPKWRQLKMRVSRAIAGLGIAAKIGLGAGVAAASATAAGAAGVLPSPAQSAVSHVVEAVTPFSMPDGDHAHSHDGEHSANHDGESADGGHRDEPTTTVVTPHEPVDAPPAGAPAPEHHDGDGTRVTTAPSSDGPAPVTGGSHDGPGTTPTTEHHVEQSMTLQCTAAHDAARVICEWSAPPTGSAKVVLLRVSDGEPGRVPYQSDNLSTRTFADTTVAAGRTYGYRVDALRSDGSVLAASPMVYVTTVSAAAASTTTTTVPGDHH